MHQDNFDEKSSTICLDSSEVKRIREGLQITQLYVSKVVGVTTDTISRWENNRYPTIRRENALKLAEALEVPLADILLKPAEPLPVENDSNKKSPANIWAAVTILALFVLIVIFIYVGRKPIPPAAVTAERLLPVFAASGSIIPVQIALTQRDDSSGFIVREYFPKGWKVIEANPPASSLDNINGIARWIVKVGDNTDRIVYLVQVDPQAKPDSLTGFQGEIVSSNQGTQSSVPVQGENKITVAPIHWADSDGNGRIDDGEMLAASYTIEDMAGVHIDWNDLEKLWDAGSYTWNKKKNRFLPKTLAP
jgi:transcriptional regulator with XRE-family HTH domain